MAFRPPAPSSQLQEISPRTTTNANEVNPMSEPVHSKNRILKQEVTLEGQSIKATDEVLELIGKVTA